MDCVKCRAPLPEGALFCPRCGKKQVRIKRARHAKRSNGYGTIFKAGGRRAKPYAARLPATYSCGVARRLLGYFATYAEAEEALFKARLQPQTNTARMTLQTLYDGFITGNYFLGLTAGSQKSHKSAWIYLQPYANVAVTALTKATFQAAITSMQAKGLKRETMAKVRNLSSLLCKEAMGCGVISVNYGQLVQLPKEDKTARLPFDTRQLEKLWQAADTGDADAMTVLVMCYTGMRPGELLGVRIDQHLHLEGEAPYFQTGSKTDAGRNRIIPIAPLILPMVRSLAAGRSEGPLIGTPTGFAYNLPNWRNRCFHPLMKRLGLTGCTPYTCRHTFANIQKRRGTDPEMMMEIMGHEDYATTVDYYHATTFEDIQSIYNAVADLERPASTSAADNK
ncbi:tyrosine-type recombinase/integrase [Agathobaculum sp.]|uniref:tyrosine-type recombinase/integrase n=1 Tax=Agathobaculum sp. TaxID=2048138 RepID=UPI002A807DF4|nr:tyrosine-type recombinase/integrase [Agathobaculum sp.]MDY3618459.1 tyrosine-type recombinase/integrase [Agathobaculum sp.]